MNGVLVVDKPEGPTSHDVVARGRRLLGTRAVGHAGTLDPMATGVLVLVVGRATRLAQFLSGQPKAYDATIRLGRSTDTWDRTGRDLPHEGRREVRWPDREEIDSRLAAFVGTHPQVPPPFSAKKIEGVRAHVLARRGTAVAVGPSVVDLLECRLTGVSLPLLTVRVRCSAGYYVRSLANDLGEALGCGACLEELRRTSSGSFTIGDAVALADLEADPALAASRVVPPERLLLNLPSVVLDGEAARRAAHGNDVAVPAAAPESGAAGAAAVRLLAPDGSLLAVARPTATPGILHPAVVLK